MANKFYTLIDVPFLIQNGVMYETIKWKAPLETLLEKSKHSKVYILRKTLGEETMEVILVDKKL
jgi:hypothetical protein